MRKEARGADGIRNRFFGTVKATTNGGIFSSLRGRCRSDDDTSENKRRRHFYLLHRKIMADMGTTREEKYKVV